MIRLLSLLFCLFFLQPGYGEEKAPTVSPWLYKKLKKTEELIANKSYQQAEQSLKAIVADVSKQTYEHATVLRSLSSVYALKGQYKKSAETLAQCLALKVLPKTQEEQAVLNLGQLYLAIEQYSKAINILEPWLASHPDPDLQINVLVANAYAQLKQYSKALPYIKKAIAKSKKVPEAWYQLNLALYYELENFRAAAKILQTMISIYPDKKEYWSQLSATYQQLKDYKKAVSIKHIAYEKGLMSSEKETLELVDLFMYIGSPYKAATILKQALGDKKVSGNSKNWETLANAWRMAKEYDRAIKALQVASKLNDKGVLYQQLGQIYVEQENWGLAVDALNKAISKGGIKNMGATLLLLGMSHYELKNIKQAEKYFLKAKQYSKNKKDAIQWLSYIAESKS